MRLKLHWQILIALGAAVIAGSLTAPEASVFGVRVLAVYELLGALFLNALKMLIVPLISASIISGISGVGAPASLGRLGAKTLLYYIATSTIAILIGLVLVNVIEPGAIAKGTDDTVFGFSTEESGAIAEKVEGKGAGDLVALVLRMVPPNIIQAAAQGEMLGLIVFSLLFGFFMTRIGEPHQGTLKAFWRGVFEVMMRITELVMKFAPVGVFALVAKVVALSGWDVFKPLAAFFFTVLVALLIHLLIVMPLLLRFLAQVNPRLHYRAMMPALLTAFSTASSSATLPLTLECVEKNAGVSNRVTSFVLPLGATVNMDGTALYECVAVIFIAQAFGIELSFAQQLTVVILALLTSIGVAGIPAASLVAITIILSSVGLPVEAVGVILAVDRILDMVRTSVNVFSDSAGAVIIGKSEGETQILRPATVPVPA